MTGIQTRITASKAMRKLDEKSETKRIQLVTTEAWLATIDEWRARQPGLSPNRSEAIRKLVDAGLRRSKERKQP